MSLDIPRIADKLNELAPPHQIGNLQEIRRQFKKLNRRPGNKIFSVQTKFDGWAFHHGGRKELQFNIGKDKDDSLRHGVAFSFELSKALKSIDVLVPKVKLFNDFMELSAGEFSDMRTWYYDDGRSKDRPPGPIPSALVKEGVFVFLGNRQPIKKIDYEKILDDFDRLLSLYMYVESDGTTEPVPFPKNRFSFKACCPKKGSTANARIRVLAGSPRACSSHCCG